MKSVCAIDVAKGKSMILLTTEYGEVLLEPHEIEHNFTNFNILKEKIISFELDDLTILMESTSTYHRCLQRYFETTDYKVKVINPILGKNNMRNLRKTKTDKEDCFNLADLFFKDSIKYHSVSINDIYSDLNSFSRQFLHLTETIVRTKNRFKQLISCTFPEYIKCFTASDIYGKTSLNFIKEFPHADLIKEKRIDALTNNLYKSSFAGSSEKRCLNKALKIKELAMNSYPGVEVNSTEVENLVNIIEILIYNTGKLKDCEIKMIELAKQTPYFQAINSIYGIGELAASQLIAELRDINRFDNVKQLNAFCGLDPTIIQSGKSINYHGSISKRGNKTARKVLFVSCCSIIRTSSLHKKDTNIYLYFRKKQAEGKHFNECIIACSTKLLRIIFSLCKNSQIN
jgi:Transposase and inactivated derivatives